MAPNHTAYSKLYPQFFNKRRGQESNLCLPGSEPGATTSSCRLGVSTFEKALRPGIAPDQRASKAHVASTRRRELVLKEQAPAAGIEPATKRLTVALPYQHRTHRNVKWRETDSNHRPPGHERPGLSHSELPTAPRTQSAQWESNPHFRHGKAVGCRYIMGAKLHHNQIVKDHGCTRHPKSTTTNAARRCPKVRHAASYTTTPRSSLSVGREALESSSAVLQTAARPSQLPAHIGLLGLSQFGHEKRLDACVTPSLHVESNSLEASVT